MIATAALALRFWSGLATKVMTGMASGRAGVSFGWFDLLLLAVVSIVQVPVALYFLKGVRSASQSKRTAL